jgi:uncharacterized membrane protein YfcA
MNMITVILVALAALTLVFIVRWSTALARELVARDGIEQSSGLPGPLLFAIGFLTNFFDTLGIGSFATTTTAFKLLHLVPDERIPATMIVGHALPVALQAFAFISVVQVDAVALVVLVAASIFGGWLGAGVVSKLPRRGIQLGMGIALLIAALFMTLSVVGWIPAGGTALTLTAARLLFAIVVNFFLGALITLGIGNYGPSLVLFSLLGMDPRAAFPIMMGSGAFVAEAAGIKFLKTGRYDRRAALGLCLGGLPGVAVAVWLVTSLPLEAVRVVVIIVVIYAALSLFRSAMSEARRQKAQWVEPAVLPPS